MIHILYINIISLITFILMPFSISYATEIDEAYKEDQITISGKLSHNNENKKKDTISLKNSQHHRLYKVPPSPEMISTLYSGYLKRGKPYRLTFETYLKVIDYRDQGIETPCCMDDNLLINPEDREEKRIDIPVSPISGTLQLKVLLVEFPDRIGPKPPSFYEDLLFSRNRLPQSKSLSDYYSEVSSGKLELKGEVHGWLRMPNSYGHYTGGKSGIGNNYPHNARKMAEDAVDVALKSGIKFERNLDKLNNNLVTALFLIHAGLGAEKLPSSICDNEIWSHKWALSSPVIVNKDPVNPDLSLRVSTYLTVSSNCHIGVCAHELGHLAFQWQDFYDPNYDTDGKHWAGSGCWDLMASGSYGGGGICPVHPAALHKVQHNWVNLEQINIEDLKEPKEFIVGPITSQNYKVLKITSPIYKERRYLMLEVRKRTGFDRSLPEGGLLVWRVDESPMESPDKPSLRLIQADGMHKLKHTGYDPGDSGDPFPGEKWITELHDSSTSFQEDQPSGINLRNIKVLKGGDVIFEVYSTLSAPSSNSADETPKPNDNLSPEKSGLFELKSKKENEKIEKSLFEPIMKSIMEHIEVRKKKYELSSTGLLSSMRENSSPDYVVPPEIEKKSVAQVEIFFHKWSNDPCFFIHMDFSDIRYDSFEHEGKAKFLGEKILSYTYKILTNMYKFKYSGKDCFYIIQTATLSPLVYASLNCPVIEYNLSSYSKDKDVKLSKIGTCPHTLNKKIVKGMNVSLNLDFYPGMPPSGHIGFNIGGECKWVKNAIEMKESSSMEPGSVGWNYKIKNKDFYESDLRLRHDWAWTINNSQTAQRKFYTELKVTYYGGLLQKNIEEPLVFPINFF